MNFGNFNKINNEGKNGSKLSSLLKVLPVAIGILVSQGVYGQEQQLKDPQNLKDKTEQINNQENQEQLLILCQSLINNLPNKTPTYSPTGYDRGGKGVYFTPEDSLDYTSNLGQFNVEVSENKEGVRGVLEQNENFCLTYKNGTTETNIEKSFGNKNVAGIALDRVNSFPGATEVTYEKAEELIIKIGMRPVVFIGIHGEEKKEKTLWLKVLNFSEVKTVLEQALKETKVEK